MPSGESEKEFPNGLYVQAPRPGAPSFIKGRISIQVDTFLEYLAKKTESGEEWLRIDVKEGFKEDEEGNLKWYAQVDTWKPSSQQSAPTKGDADVDPF
jgi:hypothetical protein|tara:strand:+ start:2222 stop:2515 length:294 start_codon:yes stop_codon:yes gene_type:complete